MRCGSLNPRMIAWGIRILKWFNEFDQAAREARIEFDAAADRLDALAREATTGYWGGTAREI